MPNAPVAEVIRLPTQDRPTALPIYKGKERAVAMREGREVGGWKPIDNIDTTQELNRRSGYFGQAQGFIEGFLDINPQSGVITVRKDLTVTDIRANIANMRNEITRRAMQMNGAQLIDQLSQPCNSEDRNSFQQADLISLVSRMEALADLENATDMTQVVQHLQETYVELRKTNEVLAQRKTLLEQREKTGNLSLDQIIERKKEKATDKEHVIYSKKVTVFGDSHGQGEKPVDGTLNVCLGDYLDPKTTFEQMGLDPQNYREGVQAWINAVQNEGAVYILGNHDLHFLAALYTTPAETNHWLDSAEGREVCRVFGVQIPQGEITPASHQDFIRSVLANPTLGAWTDMLLQKGKTYAIVNDTYIAHTIPVTNPDGSLRAMSGLTGNDSTGIDAMDNFEQNLRLLGRARREAIPAQQVQQARRQLYFNSRGHVPGADGLGPFWVREEQLRTVTDNKANSERILVALDQQAQARGARIKAVLYGHTQTGGTIDASSRIINVDYSGHFPEHRVYAASMTLEESTTVANSLESKITFPTQLGGQQDISYLVEK